MEPNARLRRSVRGFYAWVGAMLIAVVAPLLADRVIESRTAGLRLIGVAIGTAGWIPLTLVLVSVIRRGDEFSRRIHMVAIAATFALSLILLTLLDWLARGQFLEPPPLRVLWLGVAILWFINIMVTNWYFQRGS